MGGNYQQEVDLNSLFKDVAHEYVEVAMAPTQIRHLIDRAVRIALAERTVTCDHRPQRRAGRGRRAATAARARHGPLGPGLPAAADRPARRGPRPGGRDPERGRARGDAGRAGRAARRRRGDARSPTCSAPGVAKALLGKAVLPDDLPYVTGSIGLLGTKPSWDDDAGVRHAADGRLELSRTRSSCPRRARPAACRSTSTAHDRDPLPDGGQPHRRQRRDAARADPAAAAQAGPIVAREDRGRGRASGGT